MFSGATDLCETVQGLYTTQFIDKSTLQNTSLEGS